MVLDSAEPNRTFASRPTEGDGRSRAPRSTTFFLLFFTGWFHFTVCPWGGFGVAGRGWVGYGHFRLTKGSHFCSSTDLSATGLDLMAGVVGVYTITRILAF